MHGFEIERLAMQFRRLLHRLEIPRQTRRRGFRHRVALRHPPSDVLRENVRRRIRRARARR